MIVFPIFSSSAKSLVNIIATGGLNFSIKLCILLPIFLPKEYLTSTGQTTRSLSIIKSTSALLFVRQYLRECWGYFLCKKIVGAIFHHHAIIIPSF